MLRKFSKTVSIYGLAPAFSKSVGFFLLPVYTRIFCPEEYGLIDLFETVICLCVILIELEIHSAVGRYFEQTENKKLLVSTALWWQIFLSIIFVSPLIFFSADINRLLLGNISHNNTFILALSWLPLNALTYYFTVVMRFENKPLFFLLISIFQTIVKVAVSLSTILIFNLGISGIFIGYIAGDLTALCLFLLLLKKYIGINIKFSLLKELLLFSLPLVPAVIAFYASNFVSRVIILKHMSLSSIGIFAIALKVTVAFGMLNMALKMAWEPFVYANLGHDDHKKQFVRIYKMITTLLFLLACAIILFSREILFVITTKEYYAAASIIGVLSIKLVFTILTEIVGIGPKIVHKTIYDSASRTLGATVDILSMLFLIPLYGVMGAALALCIGSGTSLIVSWYYTEKFYPIGYPRLFTLYVVILMFLVVILNNFFTVPFILKSIAFLFIFLILIYYRDVIKGVINSPTTS